MQPTGKGFEIAPEIALQWIEIDPRNTSVLKPLTTADSLTSNPLGATARWIVDFGSMSIEEADTYSLPFAHVKEHVKPERLASKNKDLHKTWWLHWRSRPAMRISLQQSGGGYVFPCHSKWVIPLTLNPDSLANNSTTIIASTDEYIFALITSGPHRIWTNAQKSTLEDRT